MKLAASLLALASSVSAFAPNQVPASTTSLSETKADLEGLAAKLNPQIKFYDPVGLADQTFWGQDSEATIGFLRQSEIKHGRIAMFAFVGYCVQSNVHFPWAMTTSGLPFPSTDLSPEAQWDSLPAAAKWQIFAVIAALEIWDECGGGDMPHYMKGRQPGKYPPFQAFRDNIHFVLDLYDPAGLNKKMTQETKDKRLVAEINNGRLAMLGIFGFISADAVEGSVPALKGIAIPYDGNSMAPFTNDFTLF